METVTLYTPNDLEPGYLSPDGAVWLYSGADDLSPCDICGYALDAGYVCLDGGDFVCASHVVIVPPMIGNALAAEHAEGIDLHNRLVGMRCTVGTGLVDSFAAVQVPGKYLG